MLPIWCDNISRLLWDVGFALSTRRQPPLLLAGYWDVDRDTRCTAVGVGLPDKESSLVRGVVSKHDGAPRTGRVPRSIFLKVNSLRT
jgi:hypothetical protein